MTLPKISLIIPNYQGTATLPATLASIAKQKYPGQIEVIVVDNASTDNIKSVLTRNPSTQNNLTLKTVFLKNNLGFAAACNLGLKKATGTIIATGNNDVVYHPDCFKHLVTSLTSNPKIGLTGPKIVAYKHPQQPVMAGFRLCPWLGFQTYDHHHQNQSRPVEFLSGCTLFIKKQVIDRIGFLDERFFFYFEDTDFCWRARQTGYLLYYQPQAIVYHHQGTTSRRTLNPYQIKYLWYQSKLLMVKKHASLIQKIVFGCIQLPALLIKNLLLQDHSWPPFQQAFNKVFLNK